MSDLISEATPAEARTQRHCVTCGLDLPETRRLYCTAYCAEARHRYARARRAAQRPALPDPYGEPDQADSRHVQWLRHLQAMQRRIAEARSLAGLTVPAGW